MNETSEIRNLLVEIRDNQRLALRKQEEQLAIAREQIERSKKQIEESIGLQRQAIDRVKGITRIAIPGILCCFALIIYLLIRYF